MIHCTMPCRTDKQLSLFPTARGIAVVLAACVLTVFLPTAHATKKSQPAAADAADDPAYRRAIEDGLAEYDAGRFEEARSLFRRAHEISPNARTFRGIGMTSFELRDYVSAVHNLSAALKDQRKPLSVEQRARTKELFDRCRMFVDVYTLAISPPDARVIVDGRAPEFESDGTLNLGFGLHTLEVQAPGMVARSLSINVRGGEQKELSVTLEPVPSPAVAQVPIAAKPPVASNNAAEAWLWVSGGTALLAAGAGVYLYLQEKRLDSCHNPASGYRCTNESNIKVWRNAALGTTIGAGAAALTMALIGILSWNSGPAASQTHSALNCVASPFGITCGQSF
jgi:tetratricopeptide (TPR) repeat protein